MNTELYEYTAKKVDELLAAASSSQETRDAAQAWKDAAAAGADMDKATADLLDVLDRHHTTIDEVIVFAEGPAINLLGAATAAGMLAHARERKAAGAKFCDCAACLATQKLLAKHGRPVL
jgi:hypothetical protein